MPLKLLGMVLLIGGTTGFAWNLYKELQNRLVMLKEVRHLYHVMQNEIRYTGLPLPEILLSVSEKISSPFSDILYSIGKSEGWEQGNSFEQIWQEKMKEGLAGQSVTGEARTLLLSFPESMGFMEKEGQARALERHMEELNRWIEQMEQEEKSKKKVIVSLGMAVGILWSIILL